MRPKNASYTDVAAGPPFDHAKALGLSKETRRLVFICGRYEGIDERVSSR